MDRRAGVLLNWFIAASCLLSAGWQLMTRLQPRFVPLEIEQPLLLVSISGAVAQPGSYTLPWGATTAELVQLAGGLTDRAASDLVQLQRPLGQGDRVHVPASQAADGNARVSINDADEWTLQRLPGVGPALAGRIIAGRPFHSVDDLLDVSGIGPATLERLRPLVRP